MIGGCVAKQFVMSLYIMSRFLADTNGLRCDLKSFLSYIQGCTLRKQMFSKSPEGSGECGRVEQLVPVSPATSPVLS